MSLHPTLQQAALRQLPLNLRQRALNVFRSPRNPDLAFFGQMATLEATSDRIKLLLAPIFYTALDPAGLSVLQSPEESDERDVKHMVLSVIWAFKALKGIATGKPGLPPAALVDLWPRIWTWMSFLDSGRAQLPLPSEEDGAYAVESFYSVALELLFQIWDLKWKRHAAPLNAVVCETPGVFEMVGRAWACLSATIEQNWGGIPSVSAMIMVDRIVEGDAEKRHREELVRGVGGHAALAKIIARQFLWICSGATVSNWPGVAGPAYLILQGAVLSADDPDLDLRAALLRNRDYIPALLRALSLMTNPDAEWESLDTFMALLEDALSGRGFYRRVIEAFGYGYLNILPQCVAASRGKRSEAEVLQHVEKIVKVHLPNAAIDGTVLVTLNPWVRMVEFSGSLAPAWESLLGLVDQRVSLLTAHGQPFWSRACDNPQCCHIGTKSGFKQCSGCRLVLYCSLACQKADWLDSHRNTCVELFKTRFDAGLSRRRRSFLRVLCNNAYMRARDGLLLQHYEHFKHLQGQDNADALFRARRTIIDFTGGDVSVYPEFGSDDQLVGPAIDRVLRSQGRMELHFVRFAMGDGSEVGALPLLIPLKSPTGMKAEAFAQLASEGLGIEEEHRRLKELNSTIGDECY